MVDFFLTCIIFPIISFNSKCFQPLFILGKLPSVLFALHFTLFGNKLRHESVSLRVCFTYFARKPSSAKYSFDTLYSSNAFPFLLHLLTRCNLLVHGL